MFYLFIFFHNNNVVWNLGDDFLKFKKSIFIFLLTFLIVPLSVFAYSDKIIPGGENIGITLNSSGILVVGTYEVNGKNPAREAGLKSGDNIISINDISVSSIEDMASQINNINSDKIKIGYTRGDKKSVTTLNLYKDSDTYKTGLYVRDSVTGIGTLTYIDPKTKLFGALGHEIQDQSTRSTLEIKDGKIFSSKVTGVIPSTNGNPGEKQAEYNSNDTYGDVLENTSQGVFGVYTKDIPDKKLYKVASNDDVKLGDAKILTVLDGNEVSEYSIKITKINDEKTLNKNFVFEITDKTLLEKTNGIIQGMSGSPIIQGDYIVGAVTHVVVDNPHKGYGIFITNMLKEAEN